MTEQAYIAVAARSNKAFTFTRLREGSPQEFLPGEGTRLKFQSRATDTVELVDLPVGFLVAGDVVTVAYLGTTVFRGDVDSIIRDYSRGDTQAETVTCTGPWAKMARLVFRQLWKSASSMQLSSRLILNQSDSGNAQTVDTALSEICWGPNNVAPTACGYTVGDIDVDNVTTLPLDECRDITIADAIRRELRLFPAAVTHFDYSEATPELNIDMPDTDGDDAAYVAAVKKSHRQYVYNPHPIDGVDLEIESTSEVDGVVFRNITHQTAGNTATNNPNCLYATLQIAGFSSSSVTQSFTAVVESMVDGYGDPRGQITEPSFWKAKHPNLANVPVNAIQILEATASDDATAAQYPNIAANTVGEIQAAGLRAHVATFTAKIKITTEDDVEENRILQMQFVTTNATNKTYRWVAESSSQAGETVPSGLATAILEARSGNLRAERFTMRLGTAAQWPTIGDLCDGLILQSFTVDPINLTAELDFGTPEYLSPEDMAGLLTNFRNKRRPTLATSRVSGKVADDGASDVDMGGVMPLSSTEFSPGVKVKTTLQSSETETPAATRGGTRDATPAETPKYGKIVADCTLLDPTETMRVITLDNGVKVLATGSIGGGGMFAWHPTTKTIGAGGVMVGRRFFLATGTGTANVADGTYFCKVTLGTPPTVEVVVASTTGGSFPAPGGNISYIPIYTIANGQIYQDYRGAFVVPAYE